MTNTKLTYHDIRLLVDKVAVKASQKYLFTSIYGIPTGGCIPALLISQMTNLPIVEKPQLDCLVIDDIYDTGRTMAKYDAYCRAVLVTKKQIDIPYGMKVEANDWVKFPWERESGNIEEHVVRLLEYIGENPNREGLTETPRRVVKAYDELFSGYKQDYKKLNTVFTSDYDEMVVLKDIEFYSFCEHHMLPFFGKIHIGYIPDGKVIGISKLARMVEIFARRLQIQEQLTEQIATAIDDLLKPKGVAVKIEAKHFCMIARGVSKQNSVMVTTKLTGGFKEHEKTRAEFYKNIE